MLKINAKTVLIKISTLKIQEIEDSAVRLRSVNTQLLGITNKFKDFTIEKILAKDDLELALEVLTGKL